MVAYKLYYVGGQHTGAYGLKDASDKIIIHPASYFNDFLCSFIEECLADNKEQVAVQIKNDVPDYYARSIELVLALYNLVPKGEPIKY